MMATVLSPTDQRVITDLYPIMVPPLRNRRGASLCWCANSCFEAPR